MKGAKLFYMAVMLSLLCISATPSSAEEIPHVSVYADSYQYIKDGPVYQYYKGFPLDLSTWDGSDIFLLSGTAYHFFTRKVYEIFKKNKISNIVYENVMDYIVKEDSEEFFRTNKFKDRECYNW